MAFKLLSISKNLSIYLLCLSILAIACESGPKKIESKSKAKESNAFAANESTIQWPGLEKKESQPQSGNFRDMVHKVVVEEVLPASRYVYLKVNEKGQSFWIATRKAPFDVGTTYFYKDGLLKTNFESKEYKRIFDRIFLVSKLVPEKHGGNSLSAPNGGHNHPITEATASPNEQSVPPKVKKSGSLSIAELVANPKQYEGQKVQISGKCVKVNPNIMSRNWLHIQDGTADSFDLVVTSLKAVPEGSELTISATVVLNKDFGAGYQYDLILEEGVLVQ
ncbi:MAG: hypothetical protein AB8H47_04265 [Bacteroidia bacterium]